MVSENRIDGVKALLEIAKRRAQLALDRANAAEQRYAAAVHATQHARNEMTAMQEEYRQERGARITEMLEAPASQVQLAHVRIQYDIAAQKLTLQRQKIQVLKDDEAARAFEAQRMKREAIEAQRREQKLSEALDDMKADQRAMDEFMSELEAEP